MIFVSSSCECEVKKGKLPWVGYRDKKEWTQRVGLANHMSPDLVCGASAQNQAAKLF